MKKIPLTKDMLINTALKQIDYSDCFVENIGIQQFGTIDTFVRKYFETQPRWLAMISMNIFSKRGMQKALKNNFFTINDSVGKWVNIIFILSNFYIKNLYCYP